MPSIVRKRFDEFIATVPVPLPEDHADGTDPYIFAQRLRIAERELLQLHLGDAAGRPGRLNRALLRERCESARTDEELKGAILSVFAWGGMGHGNPARIWQSATAMPTLIKLIRQMRLNERTLYPVAAYRLFIDARKNGSLKFLGVPFFTKILYFFFPATSGVEAPILDQFSAKSINALFDASPVPLWGDQPAEPADADRACRIYAEYLECLDLLRSELQTRKGRPFSRGQVEWLLFRPGAASWRSLVTNNGYSVKTSKGEKS